MVIAGRGGGTTSPAEQARPTAQVHTGGGGVLAPRAAIVVPGTSSGRGRRPSQS